MHIDIYIKNHMDPYTNLPRARSNKCLDTNIWMALQFHILNLKDLIILVNSQSIYIIKRNATLASHKGPYKKWPTPPEMCTCT